eukprot:CAMPEP_0194267716 /NCGR_PEP_ID=MMETSP0169-20130528/2173_1 /TAXON_ID=218684 /ORGANISM="Corethron pennatum, Strain L29A3" /LENGTH=282 /DNA_ID=CAMNT_0039008665 /DNA_START=46 /DNA_END=894 /DNA_ORIENTATION=+
MDGDPELPKNGWRKVEGCVASNYPRTIYNKDEWAVFQSSYNEIYPEDAGVVGTDGFLFDYEVQNHPIRGRTIVTKQDLPRGARVWRGDWHCSFDEVEFMSFLELLPSLAYQCEILLWAYVSNGHVSVELDPGSFFNHADDKKMVNVSPSSTKRFIQAGEELLMDYSTFISYDALPWFDKLRANAWKETNSGSVRSSPKNENGEGAVAVYHNTKEYNLLGAPKQSKSKKVSTKDGVEETTTNQALHISLFSFTPLMGTIGIAVSVAVLVWRAIIRKKGPYKTG